LQRLRSLPLVTLYLTERCNSRCISCDYWRHGRVDLTAELVERLIPELLELGTRTVLISGGEPLMHRDWEEMAVRLRATGMKLWLLTSGLSLLKYAGRIARLFDQVTVSLDGVDRATYAAIRGRDALDRICRGLSALAEAGVEAGVRVTVQRHNYRQLSGFVELAQRSRARQVSFLAADVRSSQAFGRSPVFASDIALQPDDLPLFAEALDTLEREHAAEFSSGYIAESPSKLRRLWQYYAAICGLGPFPATHCNVPEFSAVIDAGGAVHPCFFIQGPAARATRGELQASLQAPAMQQLRDDIRDGRRPECEGCVCSMWRPVPA
jgi:MoaA/NifB/PqqE/SkfB family radical SAM enzyme